ncbi:MAG: OmpA family protein [Bacteroidetes bacterium]|nr:OmpA family protein [Bacteroidota bacterium]
MKRFITLTFFVATIIIAFAGCASLNDHEGEPPTAQDAPAPSGYKPIFVKQSVPIANASGSAGIYVGAVDAREPNKVKVYAHIIDSNGAYLTGATSTKWWCGATDEFDGKERKLKVNIREATINDQEPHAIALVMDHSGSMGEDRALAIQNAAEKIINTKKSEDAVTLIKYDGKVGVEVPLTSNANELRSRLQKTGLQGYGGYTAILDGIVGGINQIAPAQGYRRKAVVVFTDGQDNKSKITKDSVIALAKQKNVMICALDFGYGVNGNFLSDLAKATGGSYNRIYNTDDFDDAFEDVYRRLRNYYVLEFNPVDYGVHNVKLKVCTSKDSAKTEISFDNTPDIGSIAVLNVYFDSDKSDLKSESKAAIDNISTLMKIFPAMEIEVRGHTDSTNKTKDKDHNIKLSQKRADAVKSELIKRGYAAERITSVGFGDTRPVADNKSEDGRAQNRRTEFIITKR